MKFRLRRNREENSKKFKIGLAFGGGGARGFAHIGALKAFEENGIVNTDKEGKKVKPRII